ncbi:MAG: MFS transporter [Steroidobacteraceae bacterium]
MSTSTRGARLFLLALMLVDAIGFGIIAPVIPKLIVQLTGQELGEAAALGGWLMVTYSAMQFFAAPLLGSLSDAHGRRPVLLGSLAALVLDYLLMATAPALAWLFFGRLIAGAAGATYPTAFAVISDTTPAEARAQQFGLLGAAWGTGFILGPAIGGLLGSYGPRAPFWFAAGLAAANLLLGLLLFRETLAVENRRPFRWQQAHLVGALRALRAAAPGVTTLLLAVLLYRLAHDAMPATWAFFTMARFGWGPREIGWSLTFVGVITAIVQAGLIAPIIKALGERGAALLGFGAGALSMLGYAFAPNVPALYACIAVGGLFGVAMPAMNAIMTQRVPANAQGELQGAVAGIMSVTAVLSPLLMTQLFRTFAAAAPPLGLALPGAPFIAGALMLAVAMLIARGAVPAPRAAPAAAYRPPDGA